jgi:hypothetical protein
MEVNDQLHDPAALTPEKELPVPIEYEAGWAPEPVWTQWRREESTYPYRHSNPGYPERSLVTVLSLTEQHAIKAY